MSEIPAEVLAQLNAGQIETITLVEWLAIDQRALIEAVIPAAAPRQADALLPVLLGAFEPLEGQGVTRRLRGVGEAIARWGACQPEAYAAVIEGLLESRSDMARAWAGYAIGAEPDVPFATRLARLERLADDASMATRECAWDAWRPWFAADPAALLPALLPWAEDPRPNVRRCAVEGARPRGVWTAHIPALKAAPELARPLLDAVRQDPSRYVQLAAANWLNDASKSAPDWVLQLTASWLDAHPDDPATAAIVRRGRRTLRKQGLCD